jgi:hypothetical protein
MVRPILTLYSAAPPWIETPEKQKPTEVGFAQELAAYLRNLD